MERLCGGLGGGVSLERAEEISTERKDTAMTPFLERAIERVQQLPEAEQDAIAAVILDELADEQRWEKSFANSQEQLGKLAAKVRSDIEAGRFKDLEVEDL
jgi:hypothetical protein